MSFSLLPLELVDRILHLAVPQDWEHLEMARQLLALQLVCRTFRAILPREIFQKAKDMSLYYYTRRMNVNARSWVFMAKYELGEWQYTLPFLRAGETARSIGLWKAARGETTKAADERLYLRAAFGTMIANKDPFWVYDMLQGEEISSQDCPIRQMFPTPPSQGSDEQEMVASWKQDGYLPVFSFLGELPMMEALLESGADPNEAHKDYGYPLYAAISAERVDAMRLLIDAGADMAMSMGDEGLPLEAAARLGQLEAVKYLVEKGVDLGCALSCALAKGHKDVAAFLLHHIDKMDVNAAHDETEAPILQAILQGYSDIAEQLCHKATDSLDPNVKSDNDGDTPLNLALSKGMADVAKALLACPKTDLNLRSAAWGPTPLQTAITSGLDEIVRLILARDGIDVNYVGLKHCTALSFALDRRAYSTARLLLEYPGTKANLGSISMAPLVIAMEDPNAGDLVELLLQRREILEDGLYTGRAAVETAIDAEDIPAMRRLINLFHLDLNFSDNNDDSAGLYYDDNAEYYSMSSSIFHMAVMQPNVDLVKDLLSTGEVDLTVRCIGDPPLVCALMHPYEEVAKLLMEQEEIDINEPGRDGTPLCMAAKNKCKMTVQRLLDRPEIDPNSAPSNGPHNVLFAERRPDSDLQTHDVTSVYHWQHLFIATTPGETPLIAAAAIDGTVDTVKLILGHPAVDPNLADGHGRTPLMWAVADDDEKYCEHPEKNEETVRLLLAHPSTDPNIADNFGWTALTLVIFNKYEVLVDLLLQSPRIDPNLPNEDGCTPLLIAASLNEPRLVERLLRHPRVDIHKKLNGIETPLELAAAMGGREDIMTMLENAEHGLGN